MLRPLEAHLTSADPNFGTNPANVIMQHLNPPQYVVMCSVGDTGAVQSLDRLGRATLLSPPHAHQLGAGYFQYGTLFPYTSFNASTCDVSGKTVAGLTSAAFVAFLTDIVGNQPNGKVLRVIADNLSADETKHVDAFVSAHGNGCVHCIHTFSAGLKQVKLRVTNVERRSTSPGDSTSSPDLTGKLMRYIRRCNARPNPVIWEDFDLPRRIARDSIAAVH